VQRPIVTASCVSLSTAESSPTLSTRGSTSKVNAQIELVLYPLALNTRARALVIPLSTTGLAPCSQGMIAQASPSLPSIQV